MSRGPVPVPDQRDERDEQHGRGEQPAAPGGEVERFPAELHLLGADERRHGFPDEDEAERGPHSPGREAHDEEVVSIADLARHRVAQAGRLRVAVLEVQVEDENERERQHERSEVPERATVSLPVHPAAEEAEHQIPHREELLEPRPLHVEVAEPLPLEVEPPHADLPDERRLAIHHRGLAVLPAVEVVPEGVPGGGLAFVDGGEEMRPDGLRREHAHPEHHRAGNGRQQLPSQQRVRPPDEHRHRDGGGGEEAHHVVRVAEPQQIGDEHQRPVGARSVGVIRPPHGEPRDHREAEQRDRVDLLVDDRLVPHRERRRADEGAEHAADDPLPPLREPAHEHALGDEEPHRRRGRARERRQHVDAHGHVGRDGEQGEHAPQQHEERIPRRVREPHDVRRREVLARVPHRRGRRQGEEIEQQHGRARDRGGEIRRSVVELGGGRRHEPQEVSEHATAPRAGRNPLR